MEDRMMKFYSKESNMLALHAMHGHFATSHSHINYYVDVTSIKTRVAEAKQAAHVLYSRIPKTKYVDTIVCMDGTEVVGTFLTEEIQNGGIMGTTNQHETVYVISPEINSNNQMLFRDNNKGAIKGKHVVLLLATTTTDPQSTGMYPVLWRRDRVGSFFVWNNQFRRWGRSGNFV